MSDIERRRFLAEVRAVLSDITREPGNRSLKKAGVAADWHGRYVRLWFGSKEWHEDMPCLSIWRQMDAAGKRTAVLGACADGYASLIDARAEGRAVETKPMREPHLCYACTPPHSLEITCNFAGIIEDAKRRTPIERYVRCSVEIIGTKRRVVGSIEAGLLVTPDSDHRALRDQLRSVLGDALAFDGGRGDADDLTQTLENFIVDRWPDRAWFVEVWNEDEALTQVYAPHGMPRWR